MMRGIAWPRLALAMLLAEVLGVAVLVVLVALLGPSDPGAAQAYALRAGMWVGPASGFIGCLAGGWWVARHSPGAQPLVAGLATGVVAALLDLAIALALTGTLAPFLLVSNSLRLAGGALGGWLASRRG